jgi:hypothetical protein
VFRPNQARNQEREQQEKDDSVAENKLAPVEFFIRQQAEGEGFIRPHYLAP